MSVTYRDVAQLITGGYVIKNQKLYFQTPEYNNNMTDQGTKELLEALLQKHNINVCTVNWSDQSKFGYVPYVDIPLVITQIYVIEKELAESCKILVENGINPQNLHLMGLSFGAHIVGLAGKTFTTLTNMNIGRVTGFDPASIITNGIDITSATFVDVIHTDPNRYGIKNRAGHIDYYPNSIAYGKNGVQPVCEPIDYIESPPLTPKDGCSHRFSVDLFTEAITFGGQELLAAKAENETQWADPDFVPEQVTCMGEDVNQSCFGSFYLETYTQPLYGKGKAGLKPSPV